MVFDLLVINWTAIGAIATAGAVVVALFANHRTNKNNEKNRKLQIALLRQQRDQKKLDEMVQNLMYLCKGINSLDIIYYSLKFKDNTFTIEDRRALEKFTVDGSCNAINLVWQIEVLKNRDSARPMMDCFWEVWADYGFWASCISTLFQSMCAPQETPQEREEERRLTEMLINNMEAKTIAINAQYKSVFDDLLKAKKELMDQARAVMGVFGMEIAGQIHKKNNALYDRMKEFIHVEQERITGIVA